MPGNVCRKSEALNTFVNKTKISFKTESQEELLIEEWESTTKVKHKQTIQKPDGEDTKRTQELSPLKTKTKCNDEIKQAILRGDFTVYQGGDLNEFFGCETNVPKCVSEICLVNDHYIFVKIPQMRRKSHSGSQQSILNVYDEHNEVLKNINSAIDEKCESGRKLTKYFHCGNSRNQRRVSPICEEPLNDKTNYNQKPININWGSSTSKEVFKSTTTIIQPKNREIFVVKEAKNLQSKVEVFPKNDNNSSDTIVEQTLNAPKTSMSNMIDLTVSGRLETANAENKKNITIQPSLPKPRRRLNFNFRWFLKPFRFRSSTSKTAQLKTKKKIQALVYKTYFVSWIKAESATQQRCICQHNGGALRRCRSALF